MCRLLDGHFLVEEKLVMFFAFDLLSEGISRVLELHFAGELNFHFDTQNGQRILVDFDLSFDTHQADFIFYMNFE